MIKKRYLVFGLMGILFYGLFFYEPEINESDAKKFLAIEVTNDNVDMKITDAIDIHVSNDGEKEETSLRVADVINIKGGNEQSTVNILGVGGKVEETERVENDNITGSEVSIRSDNPMLLRAGDSSRKDNKVFVDGIGVGELYELNGQDLHVAGIKNIITIKGNCGHVTVDGIACIVRVNGASSVTVNGIGNRVYVDGSLVSKNINKDGILNFVYHD